MAEFAGRGVTLARMDQRGGKTVGLNRTVPRLDSDIVVFSDANAIYEPAAVRMLVRNFADAAVGYVTGEARYLKTGQAAADVGERAYWGYEMQMKRLETQIGSMVGGDGAIYAIRRPLWKTLPADAINDFLNPLQIVAAGWRGVYEPAAVCWEETAGGIRTEYRRRVRIVSRSWRAIFQAGRVLNPFAVGLFAWSLWSHKVLRWASGLFVLGAAVGAAGLLIEASRSWPLPVISIGIIVIMLAAATHQGRRSVATLWYFAVINAASLVGLAKGTFGRVSGVWSTPRAKSGDTPIEPGRVISVGTVFLVALGLAAAGLDTRAGGAWGQNRHGLVLGLARVSRVRLRRLPAAAGLDQVVASPARRTRTSRAPDLPVYRRQRRRVGHRSQAAQLDRAGLPPGATRDRGGVGRFGGCHQRHRPPFCAARSTAGVRTPPRQGERNQPRHGGG